MTGQPLKYRPQFGSLGANPARLSYSFVTQVAIDNGLAGRLRSHQTLVPVKRTRTISKRDLVHNSTMPNIEIDPETYNVYIDGKRVTVKPAKTLPLTQLFYFR
jgi:urease subunit alpha